jgi:hypothetical protein
VPRGTGVVKIAKGLAALIGAGFGAFAAWVAVSVGHCEHARCGWSAALGLPALLVALLSFWASVEFVRDLRGRDRAAYSVALLLGSLAVAALWFVAFLLVAGATTER